MNIDSELKLIAGVKIPCTMTIAGSDSGGGAGIEADLKTFSALGVFGTCVITAITAQNTRGVYEIFPIPAKIVKRQIDIVLKDIPVKSVKTGMLYSRGIMEVVSQSIDKYGLSVVVDPVIRSGTGDPLIFERDKETLIKLIVPRAHILTPNIPEAEMISGMRIRSLDDVKEATRRIAELGARAVIVKGGHLEAGAKTVHDVLYYDGAFKVFEKPRIDVEAHGGGCIFSAAITAHLARGMDVIRAIEGAEEFIQNSIKYSLKVGGGGSPVNPMAHLYNQSEMFRVLEDVSRAAGMIEAHPELLPYIAEVGTQVAMAVPYPLDENDVAAIEGRIVKFRDSARAVGSVQFGASRHLARIILTVMRYNPEVRAAINLHYDPKLVEAFVKAGYKVSSFDRSLEPIDIRSVEGMSLIWGTEEAIKSLGDVPDVIYDLGDVGKEPMIRVLGTTATETVNKILTSTKHRFPHRQK